MPAPAGENIQAWLVLAEAGRFERPGRRLIEENPRLRSTGGFITLRNGLQTVPRWMMPSPFTPSSASSATRRWSGWLPAPRPASGKKVLVIGAGPSGLSCAWHLNRLGHQVRSARRAAGRRHAGGGIPAYRLPCDMLDGGGPHRR